MAICTTAGYSPVECRVTCAMGISRQLQFRQSFHNLSNAADHYGDFIKVDFVKRVIQAVIVRGIGNRLYTNYPRYGDDF